MGLRTERDNLSDALLRAAEKLVRRLDSSQYLELYRLTSNARQDIKGHPYEWRPFKKLLAELHIVPSQRDDATAVMLALLPRLINQEKYARFAAKKEAQARMSQQEHADKPGKANQFVISTATSESIKKGAERFPLALERLAKK